MTSVFMKISGGDDFDWVNIGFVGDSVINKNRQIVVRQ